MPLSPKQYDVLTRPPARVNILDGSIRSGKTIASLNKYFIHLLDAPDHGLHVIFGRTADTIYRNIFTPTQTAPALAWAKDYVSYRQRNTTARILGKTVHVIGANDKQAADKLQGATIQTAYGDELSVIPQNFFQQMLGRMSAPGATMIATTNPDTPRHWLKTTYLDHAQDLGWNYWHFTMADNPGLDADYQKAIAAEYTGLWYDRYILGKWVAAEGAIFPTWDENLDVVPASQVPPMRDILAIGFDYGTTNPTVGIMLGQDLNGLLWLVDEWRIDTRDNNRPFTDRELVDSFTQWAATRPTPRFHIADPAAASFRLELSKTAHITTRPGVNNVNTGIKQMASLLAHRQLKISSNCAGFIKEAPGYVWDQKKTKEGHDAPIKADDHSIDAARYAILTTESLWRPYLPAPHSTVQA